MILVFGAGGQLGQELQRAAAQRNIALAAFTHAAADISDTAAVARALEKTQPSLVVNAAAYTKVDLAETEIEMARLGNETGPGIVASACAAAAIPLIHISTDYVFDGTKSGAYVESDPVAPLGVYGRSKLAGEEAVRRAAERFIILRTSWVYGEFGNNFLKTMLRLAKNKDELRVVADQRGCPTSTRDIAQAILRIAPRLCDGADAAGTYHFASKGATSWHGFASHIIAAQAVMTGRQPKVTAITSDQYPTPARRPANSVLDCGRFESAFGFGARPWTEEAREITQILLGNG